MKPFSVECFQVLRRRFDVASLELVLSLIFVVRHHLHLQLNYKSVIQTSSPLIPHADS